MAGSLPPSLAPKVLEHVNRFGEGWCHPQGRLPRGTCQGAYRRPWLQRYRIWNLSKAWNDVILRDIFQEGYGGELTADLSSKGTESPCSRAKTSVILNDVSLEVHGRELTGVLGSKRHRDLHIGLLRRTGDILKVYGSKGAYSVMYLSECQI